MSEFEYLAVFVSIIFAISVTHILAGAIRSIYRAETNETHFVLRLRSTRLFQVASADREISAAQSEFEENIRALFVPPDKGRGTWTE